MYETYHSGWIECITGSMFRGKSEELIRRLRRGVYAKQKVVVFKPAIDDRYHKDKIVSHNGNAIEAINITTASEILRHDLSEVVLRYHLSYLSDDPAIEESTELKNGF